MTEFGFSRTRRELPPVDISEEERETVSTGLTSPVGRALAGLRGTGQGFVRAEDIATSGSPAFRTFMEGREARGKSRESAARRAGLGLTLARSAIVGRQQQEEIDRRGQAEVDREALVQEMGQVSTEDLVANITPSQAHNPVFMGMLEERIRAGGVAEGLLKRQIEARELGVRGRELDVLEEEEVVEGKAAAMRSKVKETESQAALDAIKVAAALEEAADADSFDGALKGLAMADMPPELMIALSHQMQGENADVVRAQSRSALSTLKNAEAAKAALIAQGLKVPPLLAGAGAAIVRSHNELAEGNITDVTRAQIALIDAAARKAAIEAGIKQEKRKADIEAEKLSALQEGTTPLDNKLEQISRSAARMDALRRTAEMFRPEDGDVPQDQANLILEEFEVTKLLMEDVRKLLQQRDQEPETEPEPVISEPDVVPAASAAPAPEIPSPSTPSNDIFLPSS